MTLQWGIYWVYPPFGAILGCVKQLGALHPKGTTIFPMKKKEANNCLPRNHNFRCANCSFPMGSFNSPWNLRKKNSKQKIKKIPQTGDVRSKSEKMWKVTTHHLSQKNPSNFCCVLVSPHLLPFACLLQELQVQVPRVPASSK